MKKGTRRRENEKERPQEHANTTKQENEAPRILAASRALGTRRQGSESPREKTRRNKANATASKLKASDLVNLGKHI